MQGSSNSKQCFILSSCSGFPSPLAMSRTIPQSNLHVRPPDSRVTTYPIYKRPIIIQNTKFSLSKPWNPFKCDSNHFLCWHSNNFALFLTSDYKPPLDTWSYPFVHSIYYLTHNNYYNMITFSDNMELHIIVTLKLHAINSFPNSRCVRTIIFCWPKMPNRLNRKVESYFNFTYNLI